jgi:hypothetical protein
MTVQKHLALFAAEENLVTRHQHIEPGFMETLPEVIVSIAVIRQRLGSLPAVLETLLREQSLPPDRIVIWISPEPYLLDQGCGYDELPERVRSWHENGVVEVRSTTNTGPHRKMIPLLLEHRANPDPPIVVTADDDTLYPARWLETLVEAHRTTGTAVCYRGRVIAHSKTGLKPYHTWPKLTAYGEACSTYLLATGREGLLIRANMFDTRTFSGDHIRLSRSRCDVWMTAGLIAGGTEMQKLSMARLFPDPSGLVPRDDYSLPKPSPLCPAAAKAAARSHQTELWRYNHDRNDAMIDATFRYFDIIGHAPEGSSVM